MSIENLNEPLNTVAETNDRNLDSLVFSLLDRDMDLIQKLGDEPNVDNNLTAAELKAKFDEAGNIIKDYINNTLVPSISDTVAEAEVRAAAEAERISNENARISAESERKSSESNRVAAEAVRITAESTRVSNENERISAENIRQANESARVAAEVKREDLETGYVAQAKAWAEQAKEAAGGDFAPKTHAIQHAANGGDPITPAMIGAAPATRKVNGKALSSDVTLAAADVGAYRTSAKALSSTDDLHKLASDNYYFEGTVPSGMNYPPSLVGQYAHVQIYVLNKLDFGNGYGYGTIMLFHNGSFYVDTWKYDAWTGWNKYATTDTALMRNGSNTMTGALWLGSGYGRTHSGADITSLMHFPTANDMSTYNAICISATGANSGTVMLRQKTPSSDVFHHILHTGNLAANNIGQIVTGSYVGTGAYGEANPNSLTFDKPPKWLAVCASSGESLNSGMTAPLSTEYASNVWYIRRGDGNWGWNTSGYAKCSADRKTISWYVSGFQDTFTGDKAGVQMNASGVTYRYFAIL